MATRCFWPPESRPGYRWPPSPQGRPSPVPCIARRLGLGLRHATHPVRSPSITFCRIAVMCGNRLNCWNTMPTSLAHLVDALAHRWSCSGMPLTTISPSWCASSRLTQRISVDLPEPDGPADDDALALHDLEVDVAQHVEIRVPLVHPDNLDRHLGLTDRHLGGVDRRSPIDSMLLITTSCSRC
jgi:hypothetical protein